MEISILLNMQYNKNEMCSKFSEQNKAPFERTTQTQMLADQLWISASCSGKQLMIQWEHA